MMMSPTKKKIILAAVVAFLIPVVIGSIIFLNYSKNKNEEIERLKIESATERRYVFARNMLAGEYITSGDVKVVDVKSTNIPLDAYKGDVRNEVTYLKEIVGKKILINAEANTLVTKSMFMQEEGVPTIDERLQEFNMIVLPSDLKVGDFVDVRMSMVEGEDYLVISGKEVKKIGASPESNTMFLQLTEEEILRMTAAILESYLNDGYKMYANKYVDPSNQLYDYERVNYVEKVKKVTEEIVKEREMLAKTSPISYLTKYEPERYQLISGDIIASGDIYVFSGDVKVSGDTYVFSGDKNKTVVDTIVVSEEQIKNSEIAVKVGLTEKETEDIRNALISSNSNILNLYNDKLVATRKNMINTYPVKENIANLIKSDPNILDTIKAKYNVEKLVEQRASLLEFPLFKVNEYGETEETDALSKIQENITKEIETQRLERKEYLQALILAESENVE